MSVSAIQVGIPAAKARSYAYDNSNYIQAECYDFSIAAAVSSTAKFTTFTAKQLKSITAVPTAVPSSAGDNLALTLVSLAPQVFGTATGGNYAGNASGTNTATGSNTVTVVNAVVFGTSQPAFNPTYANLSGGTFTVVVANGVGTNTQTGYVFPTGPNGGLSLAPGDVVTLTKSGTDTSGVYIGEAEVYYTPGTNLTI